jgi:hypothetical protein
MSTALTYKDIVELRKDLESLGVTSESQNRLPLFEPTLRPTYRKRVFENKYGKLLVEGRLGQNHKNLLEMILWKNEFHLFIEEDGKLHLKVAYDEAKIRKYLSQETKYSYETYKRLIKDMIQTYIELKTKKLEIQGTLLMEVYKSSSVIKPVESKSPIIPTKAPLKVAKFGAVGTALMEKELKFTYNPKLIASLDNGISQALVRYLRTHKRHPKSGYHLRELIGNLTENTEGQDWWNIKRFLKKDAEKLEALGITINFKEDRLFVVGGRVKV